MGATSCRSCSSEQHACPQAAGRRGDQKRGTLIACIVLLNAAALEDMFGAAIRREIVSAHWHIQSRGERQLNCGKPQFEPDWAGTENARGGRANVILFGIIDHFRDVPPLCSVQLVRGCKLRRSVYAILLDHGGWFCCCLSDPAALRSRPTA
jgi:hypothetical protein